MTLMHILIAGGTGTSGRVLAARAKAAGHQVRVLSRHPRGNADGPEYAAGDLITGAGLNQAVAGVDAVVDLSNIAAARYQPAAAFFTTATDHLFAAEQRAGVGHHLTLSIVGVDRFRSGYYRAKLAQEAAVTAASARTGVGYTIARVTQFHDFAALVLQRFRIGRLVAAPPLLAQPVHLDDVADHLLGLLADGPGGYAPELGGPQPEEVPDMVRRFAQATGAPVWVRPAPLFGAARRANEAGVLRPAGGVRGALSFDHWLGEVSSWAQPSRV
jgi:uncharacterized protein YbjT (DUF2867 family)